MKVLYDREADALYVPIQGKGASVFRSQIVDERRSVDFDDRDEIVGIEVLDASHGVKLMDLVRPYRLEYLDDEFREIEHYQFTPSVEYA